MTDKEYEDYYNDEFHRQELGMSSLGAHIPIPDVVTPVRAFGRQVITAEEHCRQLIEELAGAKQDAKDWEDTAQDAGRRADRSQKLLRPYMMAALAGWLVVGVGLAVWMVSLILG